MKRLLHSYVFWTHERGSFHYDVMVTLILAFLFVSPHFIDFRARPVLTVPIRSSEVLVRESGSVQGLSRFVYEVRREDVVDASSDAEVRAGLLRVIEPIAGYVKLDSYKPVTDAKGRVVAYDATVLR